MFVQSAFVALFIYLDTFIFKCIFFKKNYFHFCLDLMLLNNSTPLASKLSSVLSVMMSSLVIDSKQIVAIYFISHLTQIMKNVITTYKVLNHIVVNYIYNVQMK